MANKIEYVELGLVCADVCRALDRGMNGKQLGDLSDSVRQAIAQLTTWVKPVVHNSDGYSLMILLIVELSRRSRRKSSTNVGGDHSPGSSMRGMIRVRLLLGSQTLAGYFRYSTCVQ